MSDAGGFFVRTAGSGDLPAVRALLAETWHDTYDAIYGAARVREITQDWHSIPALQARLAAPNGEFVVADDGTQIGGMAFGRAADDGRAVMLHQLYVRPGLQGRGIGTLLLREMQDCFPEACAMRLEVEEANRKARAFYEAHGFAEAGRTANCGAQQSGIPALIYEKAL